MFQQKNQRRICRTVLLWIPAVEQKTFPVTSQAWFINSVPLLQSYLYLAFFFLLEFKLSVKCDNRQESTPQEVSVLTFL